MDWESIRRWISGAVKFWWWRIAVAGFIFWFAQQLVIHRDALVVGIGQARQEYPSTTHFFLAVVAFMLNVVLVVLVTKWGLRAAMVINRKEVFTITGDNGRVAALMSDGSWSVYYSLKSLALVEAVSSSRDDVKVKTDSDGEETVERCYPQWAQPKGLHTMWITPPLFLAAPTHNVHGLTLVEGVSYPHTVWTALHRRSVYLFLSLARRKPRTFHVPRHRQNALLRAILSTGASLYDRTQSKMLIVLALLLLPASRVGTPLCDPVGSLR